MTTFLSPASHRAARSLTPPPQTHPTNDRSRPAASITPAQAVRAAARAIASNVLEPVCAPGAGLAFQPRSMLAVLTYCYASDIYCSQEVEDLMRCDDTFRSVCGDEVPDARTLRRFRRHNHEALEHCLFAVLRMLADQRGAHPADAEVIEDAQQRLNTAVLMDLHEN